MLLSYNHCLIKKSCSFLDVSPAALKAMAKNWGNQPFQCHQVQARKILLGFSLFQIPLGATLKVFAGSNIIIYSCIKTIVVKN